MKKRIITILLTFVITMALMPVQGNVDNAYAGTNGHSQAEAVSWANGQVGKALDIDGQYGAQCVDFTCYYYQYLGQAIPWGNAGEYVNGGKFCPSGWSYQGSPQPGDIAVWRGNPGHVAIVTEIRGSQMVCVEQNYAGKMYVTPNLHSIDASTYIRPDFAAPINHNPSIAFDSVEVKPGRVRVTGWAFDPDDPTRSIDVHAYLFVNGNPTCIGGTTANKSRKDVDNAYHVGEFHGFDATFDTNIVGGAEAQVAAINIGEGANVWSDKKQISVPNPNPVGCIDSVTDNGSSIKVTGWAFDPSDTSKQIELHVYIGGSAGSNGAEGHNGIIANLERKDVNKAYKCGDYHGFSAVIPTNKVGSQQVFIYGINIGAGWDNTCFGSKTVTITKHAHTLAKIPAKAATATATGNIEYWTCRGCGKCFKDSAGKTEIKKSDTITAKKKSAAATPKLYLSRKAYTWNNKVQTPKIAVKAGSKTLPASCYKVTLPKGRKNVGKYTIKVTLKNGYSGTRSASYTIKPKGTGLTGVTAASKAATVKWAKQTAKMSTARITGYQIQYSMKKDFKSGNKAVNVGGYTKTSRKITGLASKKTYYFRVRTYLKSGSKTYYSGWSKARAVKVK